MKPKNINNSELQQIKSYCQEQNLNMLTLNDLQQQQTQSPQGFNWKSPYFSRGSDWIDYLFC